LFTARRLALGDAPLTQHTSEHADLADRCLAALLQLAGAARPAASTWSELDLSISRLKAVAVLACEGPRSIGELGRALGISEPGASALVDGLEEAGLAGRESDANDRRRVLVVPTPAALSLSERLRQVRRERVAGWLDHMDDDDLRALLRGLQALTAAVDEAAGAVPEGAGR
jgi:DNA-binding MarR family transcriptional regulator